MGSDEADARDVPTEHRAARTRWRPGRKYWRHHPFVAWAFRLRPKKCMSCGQRREHTNDCYFA